MICNSGSNIGCNRGSGISCSRESEDFFVSHSNSRSSMLASIAESLFAFSVLDIIFRTSFRTICSGGVASTTTV